MWLAWRLRALWTPFVLALALAYVLEPAVTLLERREVPRGVAILAVYLALGMLAGLVATCVGPSLYAEVQQLAGSLPRQTEHLQQQAVELLGRVRTDGLPVALQRAIDGGVQRAEALLARFAARVADVLLGVVSQVLNLIIAPVLAYYILKDRERLATGLLGLLPAAWQPPALRVALEVDRSLASVIRGQLLVSGLVGALVGIGLAVLKVPYALLLGLLTALLDIIPYFGPVAAGLPIVGLSLTRGPWTALWAVGLLVAANQLESAVLQPKVMSRSTGLHPLVVIAAVLAGAELGGVVGMLAAVPLAAAVRGVWQGLQTPSPGPGQVAQAPQAPLERGPAAGQESRPKRDEPEGTRGGEVVGRSNLARPGSRPSSPTAQH